MGKTAQSDSTSVPQAGGGKRGKDGHIAYLLRQANSVVRLSLERALAKQGLTLPQFMVLTMLRAYPGLSGAELARVALITPQTVGVITRNLEKLKLIVKTEAPQSRRILQLRLTQDGEKLLASCHSGVDAVERQMLSSLNSKDELIVRRWLVFLASEASAHPTAE